MRPTTRFLTIAVAVTTLVVPAAAAGAAPASASTARPASITWAPCAEDATADCGTLSVPIDWSRPNGRKVDLALARRKATDPSARIGSLVINPGGPGGSGVNFALFGTGYFSDEIQRHFDLVGFDPRGVARSHPVVCSLDLALQQPSPILTSQADFDRMVAYNQQLGNDCRRQTGPLFDHVDTASVVRDVDAIRAAVGDEKLSYYGVSYGTLIGQEYAETFPHRVRALALDSNMDHSLGTAGFLFTETATAEDSFDEFVKGCSADTRCPLYGRDIRALWADLLARAGRGELRNPFDPTVLLTPLDLLNVALGSFYGPDWFALADLLVAVDTQTPPTAASRATIARHGWSTAPDLIDNPLAVFCEDWKLPLRDYNEFAGYVKALNRVAPDMRYSPLALSVTVACLGWPAKVNNPQHPLRVQGSPTLLLVNGLHDPATGYAWAVNAAAQLGREGRLVTYEGWGHGAYGRGTCVTGVVDSYLVAGTLPAAGARCAAVPPQPFSVNEGRSQGLPQPAVPRWNLT
jgi:pimeloyl-ACP methyl ester carboxylesterase